MNTAKQYAEALMLLMEEKPKEAMVFLHNLVAVLKRRGHSKLLPRIFIEYRNLELKKERAQMHARITPEQERTRTLLELYRKLTTAA